jgi:hypothetical protein
VTGIRITYNILREHSSGIKDMPWYDGKKVIREYLRELNKDKKASLLQLEKPVPSSASP